MECKNFGEDVQAIEKIECENGTFTHNLDRNSQCFVHFTKNFGPPVTETFKNFIIYFIIILSFI